PVSMGLSPRGSVAGTDRPPPPGSLHTGSSIMCEAGPPLDGYAVVRRDLTEYHLLVVAGGRCPPRRLPGLALAEQRPAVLHRAGARKGTPLQRQVHRPPGRERVGGRGRAVHARLRARARHVEDARAGDADGAGHRPTATSPYYSAEPSSSLRSSWWSLFPTW